VLSFGQGPTLVPDSATRKIVPVEKSLKEWKRQLTRRQFNVARRGDTEPPFSGKLWNNKRHGTYYCVCCDLELFDWRTKFESNTGWPSFWQVIDRDCIRLLIDHSDPNEVRTEVRCAQCDAHLGHVFDDGPAPSGLRFCMNSAALTFVADAETAAPQVRATAKRAGDN
jgi:peptide-methionine (R)-S-oxide reductase